MPYKRYNLQLSNSEDPICNYGVSFSINLLKTVTDINDQLTIRSWNIYTFHKSSTLGEKITSFPCNYKHFLEHCN